MCRTGYLSYKQPNGSISPLRRPFFSARISPGHIFTLPLYAHPEPEVFDSYSTRLPVHKQIWTQMTSGPVQFCQLLTQSTPFSSHSITHIVRSMPDDDLFVIFGSLIRPAGRCIGSPLAPKRSPSGGAIYSFSCCQ